MEAARDRSDNRVGNLVDTGADNRVHVQADNQADNQADVRVMNGIDRQFTNWASNPPNPVTTRS